MPDSKAKKRSLNGYQKAWCDMGLEVITKDMKIYPVIPERAPAYLKVEIRPGKNFQKITDKLFKLPMSDRRELKSNDAQIPNVWNVYNYDKYFLQFPEFRRVHNLILRKPRLV
jgi:hypothetical protein